MKANVNKRAVINSGIFLTVLLLAGRPDILQAQALKSTGYVTVAHGRVYVVEKNQSAPLLRPMSLTQELTVLTNGMIKISGDGQEKLPEGRKVSLDGFWLQDDGTLVDFKPHYLIKDGALFAVTSGLLTRLDHDVLLGSGTILRTDSTLLTPDQRIIRLQDGQKMAPDGSPVPPLDHVMMLDGKLVLQKDGSIVPLPVVSTIGMSEGTRVTGNGVITRPNGEQFTLSDGERLTLEGAAMPKIQ